MSYSIAQRSYRARVTTMIADIQAGLLPRLAKVTHKATSRQTTHFQYHVIRISMQSPLVVLWRYFAPPKAAWSGGQAGAGAGGPYVVTPKYGAGMGVPTSSACHDRGYRQDSINLYGEDIKIIRKQYRTEQSATFGNKSQLYRSHECWLHQPVFYQKCVRLYLQQWCKEVLQMCSLATHI